MDLATTNNTTYKGDKGLPKDPKYQELADNGKPVVQMSSYQASFPNWDNGKKDVFHEKHPQYPYYSLPFKGESTYKNNFTDAQLKELKRRQELVSGKNSANSALK